MKKYQLGDKWSNDFDYDGLIRSCNDADVSWGADKLEKLYDSLVDVNYHDLARDVDKAVEHLRREDEGDMAVAIESLDKVRETIKKDYFEHESGYVNTEVDDEGNEKVVLYDDKGESKGSFASEKQALKYAKEIGLSPDVMAQGGEISVNDWEDLAEESFFKEEVVVVNGQRYVVSEIKGTPYGNSIIFIGIDLNNRGQGKKVLFDYGSGINKIEDYAKGGEIGYKEKVIKELEELGYFEYNAKELYQKHRDLIDLSDKKSPKAMARSLANTEGHSYAKGGKIETQKAIDRLQLKLDALDEEIDQSPISDINLAMKEYKEIQSEIERHKKDLSKPYAEGGEIPKSVVEEFKSKLKDENFPYREDDLDLYYEENYTWKEEEDNRKKLIDQIDLGDLVEAENGQNYYVVYDYSDGFYWVTKRESERYNEDASGYTLDKDNIVRIIEKGSSYAKGGSTKAEYVVTLSNPADSTPSGKKSFTLKASSPEEARKIATEIIKKDFGYYLSIGYNDIRIKKKMAKGGEVEAEHYWKPINEETVEDSLYKYYYDYPKGTTFDGRIWVSFKGLSHSKDNLYERIDAIRNNVHWVSYTISDEPKSAYGTEGSWSSIYISIGNLTANEIREILLGSEGDSSLPTRVGEDLETEGIKAGELGFETYGKYVDLEVNTEGEEDEYAKGGALDKEFKFTKNFVIYVPSTSNVGDTISKSELEKRVKEVEKYVADEFGGYTETETEGGYKSTSGDIIEEDVVKVSVFAQNDDWKKNEGKVVAKVKEWAKKWGQEAIGFEYEGDLYYIDDDGKFTLGGVLMAGIAGYVGYKIGRARPQKKGFETEKAVGRKFGKKFKRKKKMSKGGQTYAGGGEIKEYDKVSIKEKSRIYKSHKEDLSKGKEYSVSWKKGNRIGLINDKGTIMGYPISLFEKIGTMGNPLVMSSREREIIDLKTKTYAEGGEIEGYNMDEVVKHFVMAGLWASNDDEGEPLEDSYDADDVSKESYEKIAKGATKFINENKALLKKHNISTESLGHDLFLDSQGHGVGFWDRGYGDDGDTLSKSASKIFASDQPYVGDDKKIYFKKGGSIKSSFFSGELSFLNW